MIDQIALETDARHRRTAAEQRAARERLIRTTPRSLVAEARDESRQATAAVGALRVRLAGWVASHRLRSTPAR